MNFALDRAWASPIRLSPAIFQVSSIMSQPIPPASSDLSADPEWSGVELPFGTVPEVDAMASVRLWFEASADDTEFDEDDFDDDFDDDFEDELDEELNDDLDEFDEDI